MAAPQATIDGVQYRFLDDVYDPAWERIDFDHITRDCDPPNRRLARVAVAEDPDGALSYYILQPMIHAEPLKIDTHHRGRPGVLVNLIAMVQAVVAKDAAIAVPVFVVADDPAVSKMCEALGMERVTSPVYVKRVTK